MVTTETGDDLDATALALEVSMSEISRQYIEVGARFSRMAGEYGLDVDTLAQIAELAAIRQITPDEPAAETVVEPETARPATLTVEIPID